MKKYAVFFLLFLQYYSGQSQDSFSLLLFKGTVMAFSTEWKEIPTNQNPTKLIGISQIRISGGEYCLIEVENKGLLELSTKGDFKLEEIVSARIWPNAQIAALEYQAVDSLKSASKNTIAPNAKLETDLYKSIDKLAINPPPTLILGKTVEFHWEQLYNNTYWFEIINTETGKAYFTTSCGKNEYTLNANQLPYNTCLHWRIRVEGSKYESQPRALSRLNFAESSILLSEQYLLDQQLNTDKSALHCLIMAQWFERNGINDKALEMYQSAIRLSSQHPAYYTLYIHFIKRASHYNPIDCPQ